MVGEKKHPYSICCWQWCLLDYWIYKFWGWFVFFLSGLRNAWVAFWQLQEWTGCFLGPLQSCTTDQSLQDASAHIFFLLPFLTQNFCRKNRSQPSVHQNFLIKMVVLFFFNPNKIVKNKTFPTIHMFQFSHVCNGSLIYSLIKTIWKITSPNFFTRENTSVGLGKPWWESQQWFWYISQKLKYITKVCRDEKATKLKSCTPCKTSCSVFSPGKKRVCCADGLSDSVAMASPYTASFPPSFPPCLGRENLLGFKSFSARRNSERRKTAGKHIHASCKGMHLKYYCEAQHHFPKISHSLK